MWADMTIGWCITYCLDLSVNMNNRYAGVEDGNQCFCGIDGSNYTFYGRRNDGECSKPCIGNRVENLNQTCGGAYRIQVYDCKF